MSVSDNYIYAKKGDVLTCDACKSEIYKFAKEVHYGDTREATQMEGINGYQNPQDGDECICPNCGAPIFL